MMKCRPIIVIFNCEYLHNVNTNRQLELFSYVRNYRIASIEEIVAETATPKKTASAKLYTKYLDYQHDYLKKCCIHALRIIYSLTIGFYCLFVEFAGDFEVHRTYYNSHLCTLHRAPLDLKITQQVYVTCPFLCISLFLCLSSRSNFLCPQKTRIFPTELYAVVAW